MTDGRGSKRNQPEIRRRAQTERQDAGAKPGRHHDGMAGLANFAAEIVKIGAPRQEKRADGRRHHLTTMGMPREQQ